jgi:hypothetical protein
MVVVQAHLYAGQPVGTVRLKRLGKSVALTNMKVESYDKETGESIMVDTTAYIVNNRYVDNATVTISTGGVAYPLTLSDSGKYRDAGGTLIIDAGKTYRLDITVDDKHIWAETTVPKRNGGILISRDTVYYTNSPEDSCGKFGCKDDTEKVSEVYSEKDDLKKTTSRNAVPDSLQYLTARWDRESPGEWAFYIYKFSHISGSSYIMADSLRFVCRTDDESTLDLGGDNSIVYFSGEPMHCTVEIARASAEFRYMVGDHYMIGDRYNDSTNQDFWNDTHGNINGGLGFFVSFCSDFLSFEVVPWKGN